MQFTCMLHDVDFAFFELLLEQAEAAVERLATFRSYIATSSCTLGLGGSESFLSLKTSYYLSAKRTITSSQQN